MESYCRASIFDELSGGGSLCFCNWLRHIESRRSEHTSKSCDNEGFD